MTDSQLLSEFVDSRSQDAFTGIVQRYIILVHSTARRMIPDEHLAQDVVQATFIVLLKKAPSVNPRTLPGWLVNTTRLAAMEALRAERTRQKREAQIAAVRRPIAPTGDEPGVEQMLPLLDDALSRLNPADRAAVVMRFLEGASFAQVAAAMGSTEDTARKRVARALEKLRKIFTKQGVTPGIAGLMAFLAAQQAHAAPASVITATTNSLFTGGTPASSNLARAVLSARNWTKVITLVVVSIILIILGCVSWMLLSRSSKTPTPDLATTTGHTIEAPAARPAAPPEMTYSQLWLKTFKVGPFKRQPLIVRELYRQALLIAARDGMGLQTRDESLREWRESPPPDQTLNVVMQDTSAEVTRADDATDILDNQDLPPGDDKYDLDIVARDAEALSRDQYVAMLKANHWSGNGNIIKPDGAAPADAEARLGELNELSQFAILRETHALIHTDGETPQRLAVLIRAYANLGRLTWIDWSINNRVFTARSLLYAQRLVVQFPDSPQSYWLRAYAKAMTGLPQPALDDLDAADKLQSNTLPPPWVESIRLYCQGQTKKLDSLAVSNPSQTPLATFLAYLSVLTSDNGQPYTETTQLALKANPTCIRLFYGLCGHDDLPREKASQAFSNLLGAKLDGMPNLPQPILDEIQKLRRPGGNSNGRETICQALITQGNPALDKGEPSWAALGRLIQETSFTLIEQCQARYKSADYTAQIRPLIADHPFAPLIEAYGINDYSTNTHDTVVKLLQSIPWEDITWLEGNLNSMEVYFSSKGPSSAKDVWNATIDGLDSTTPDLEMEISLSDDSYRRRDPFGHIRALRRISPHSVWVVICDIKQGRWDPQTAAQWEANYGYNFKVIAVLAQKYSDLKQWTDAERCYRECITINPVLANYRVLAWAYRNGGKPDQYVAVLKEYLAKGHSRPDVAAVNMELAQYYMFINEYRQALPFADAAVDSGAEGAIQCAALAHTEVGDFDIAEKLMIKDYQSQGEGSPYYWYVWCLHTGHGNVTAAKKALDDFFSNRSRDNLSSEDLLELGCLAMRDKKYSDAVPLFKRREILDPRDNCASILYETVCADKMHDPATRDQLFQQIDSMGLRAENGVTQAVELLAAAYRGGPDCKLDTDSIDKILSWDYDSENRVLISYFSACCLQTHGQQDQATQYLRQCYAKCPDMNACWLLIDQDLRDQGIDPFLITKPDIQPATHPSAATLP